MIHYRQGDVLLVRIKRPRRTMKKNPDNIVLRGEATGHAHRIVNGQVFRNGWSGLVVESKQNTQLVHEEHNTINLKPGYYEVVRQREYDPIRTRWVYD